MRTQAGTGKEGEVITGKIKTTANDYHRAASRSENNNSKAFWSGKIEEEKEKEKEKKEKELPATRAISNRANEIDAKSSEKENLLHLAF